MGYLGLLIVFCLSLLSMQAPQTYAQQSVVDEITPKLNDYVEENEERVDMLLRLAEGYLFVSPVRSETIGLEAKVLSEKINYKSGTIRSLLLIGRSFQFRGDFSNDIVNFLNALYLAEIEENIPLMADIYRNMGEHYLFSGSHAKALSSLQMAINYAEQQTDKRLIGATYFSMGSFLTKVDKLDDAENYYLKALPIFEEIDEKRGVAVLYGSLGIIYKQQGNLELGYEFLNKSIELFHELGDFLSLAESYLILARLEKQTEKYDEAVEHLNTALFYAESSKDLNQNTLILMELGLVSLEMQSYEKAESYLLQALEYSSLTKIKENQLEAHSSLSKLYKLTNNPEKSLFHLEVYNKLRDELYPLSYGEDLLKIQTQFEAEQRESELNSLRRIQAENALEMERERTRLNTAIAAIVFVLMLVGVLALRYNAKAQSARQMALHNKQLLEIGKELEHVNRVKSDFLANTSHEIRTPLNGILGMVTLLMRSHLSDAQKDQVHAIELSGKKLLDLVNDLLDLTKIEAGKIEIIYAPMNLAETLSHEVQIWEDLAKKQGLDFNFSISPDLPHKLTAASARIIQVLTNLVGNAVKFTTSGSVSLTISVEKDFGQEVLVRFDVEDTGIGIAEDKLTHLFERFSQIDSGLSRSFQGTGLGLAISRDLVRIMNGSIGVDSVEDKGSNFWFRLPMHINQRTISRDEMDKLAIKKEKSDKDLSLKVLVVEDNHINQAVIKGMLDHLGHETAFAENGLEAIERVVEVSPDVVLMDIQMPIMDGMEATKEIRKLKGNVAKTPIIAITANAMSGDAERFMDAGMDAYLAKPINIERLQKLLVDINHTIAIREG